MALNNEFMMGGIKKIRRLGHTMEFEQIKEYVPGDDGEPLIGKLLLNAIN